MGLILNCGLRIPDCGLKITDFRFTSWLPSAVGITGCRLQIPDCGLQINFEAAIGGADYTIKSNCIHSVFEGLSVTITEYCKNLNNRFKIVLVLFFLVFVLNFKIK